MLSKWFAKRKADVIETSADGDVDVVFSTLSDFEDVEMSQMDDAEPYKVSDDLDFPEYPDEAMDKVPPEDTAGDDQNITSVASLEHRAAPLLGLALAALIPLGIYIALLNLPHLDQSFMLIRTYFFGVTGVSALVALTALIVGIVGSRLGNIQVILLSMAFTSLGVVFTLQGLATPGFILPENAAFEMVAPLSLFLTLAWFYLSSLSANVSVIRNLSRFQNILVPVWTGLIALMSALLFFQPGLARLLPFSTNPLKFFVALVVLELAIMTGWNYWCAYVYTRSFLQLTLAYSSVWLAVSAIIMSTGKPWHASWWMYHGLLLVSVISMIVGLLLDHDSRRLALALVGKSHRASVEPPKAVVTADVEFFNEESDADQDLEAFTTVQMR